MPDITCVSLVVFNCEASRSYLQPSSENIKLLQKNFGAELQTRMQLSPRLTLLSLRASKMKFRSQMLRGVSLVLFMVQISSYSSNKYAPPSTRPTTWKMASLFQIRSKHISTSFEMMLFIFRLP